MEMPKSGFKGFRQNWQADLKAGFVVSLVALPISIALALASGAPAISGLISAVIGGLVVAHLGGSYVTITGPGNGLAVITLTSIMALGGGDMLQGFYLTLAAVVFSGFLLFVLGTIRLGILADLFPTSAVRGMLAAIGIIILAKQSHVMIGTLDPEESAPIPLLIEFVASLRTLPAAAPMVLKAAAVGLGSLLFLVFFSRLPYTWLHRVPGPLWVVLMALGVQMLGTRWQGTSFFDNTLLVNIPEDWMSTWRPPDFSAVYRPEFWSAVVGLTFIASIESLLSIKGMDRLDPYKRKSNVNKDLRALGLATIMSGLLGGLSVVTVIARSSVNVNNGAKTRSSNFFTGVLILVFVVFLRNWLVQIPLPALAAILVYTGYKLLNPSQFRSIADIGLEQLFLFFVTLFSTLVFGLILGILIGMLATLLVQAYITGAGSDMLRYLGRPNTLLYEEDPGKFLLHVNYFANFLNYPRLKSKLDSVPATSTLIADFSQTRFVDHTVMDHLSGYVELFEQKGGTFEIVGLEAFAPSASHPLGVQSHSTATKERLNAAKNTFVQDATSVRLSGKQQKLSAFAVLHEMEYTAWPSPKWDRRLAQFDYFRYRRIDYTTNLLRDRPAGLFAIEVVTHSGEFIMKDSQQLACVVLEPKGVELPEFVLYRERMIERLAQWAGAAEVKLGDSRFDQRYALKGRDEAALRTFFNQACIDFLMERPTFHVESNGKSLLIFHKERVASVAEFKLMVSFAREWAERIISVLATPEKGE